MNNKIAVMITASVGFLILQTSSSVTVLAYLKDIYLMHIASDLLISVVEFGDGTQYLDEIPMANYLDK